VLIVCAISFQDFQPMWSQSTNSQTDRQTDRQMDRRTTCDRKTALCTKVHCVAKRVPSDKFVMLWDVCWSVCPSDNWKSCERILTKFLGGVEHGSRTNELNFGDDLDHCPDPGVRSPKSAFTGLSKKLPTVYDEILRRAGWWPRDQLITFWWRSASLSGSGSPFRITMRIREELPRCQHTQNRYPQCSPNEFNFGDDPDHRPDPGVRSPKSGFTGLSIMLSFGGGLRSLSTSSSSCYFCDFFCVFL